MGGSESAMCGRHVQNGKRLGASHLKLRRRYVLFFSSHIVYRSPITLRKIRIAWIRLFQKRPRAKRPSNPAVHTRRLLSISELRVRFSANIPSHSASIGSKCLDARGDYRPIYFRNERIARLKSGL